MSLAFKNESTRKDANNGIICEVKSFNQCNSLLQGSITRYSTASMICGYCSCANALFIAENFLSENLHKTHDEIDGLITSLNDLSTMKRRYEAVMAPILEWRKTYIKNNEDKFSQEQKDHYIKDWVANYEISDWLKLVKNEKVCFIRTVEYSPDTYDKATYEEKERLLEELPFFEKYRILIDDPLLDKSNKYLWHPEEWLTKSQNTPKVFVVDVIGHFVVALPIICEGNNMLLVINSYTPDSCGTMPISSFFELFFNKNYESCNFNK